VEFLKKLFGGGSSDSSAGKAKNRLISVLIHDRTDISPVLLENLRIEMIDLLKKYMEIDESNIEINLDHGANEVALVANVPVRSVKRGAGIFSESGFSEKNSPEENKATRTGTPRNQNKNRRHR